MTVTTALAAPGGASSRFHLQAAAALAGLAALLSAAAGALGLAPVLLAGWLEPRRPLPGAPAACAAAGLAFFAGWWPLVSAAGPLSLLGAILVGLAACAPLAVDGRIPDPLPGGDGSAGKALAARPGNGLAVSAQLGDPLAWVAAAGLPALAGLAAQLAERARGRSRGTASVVQSPHRGGARWSRSWASRGRSRS